MAHSVVMEATLRTALGTGATRSIRREDGIPAVIYGGEKNKAPVHVNIARYKLDKIIKKGSFFSTVFTIKYPEGEERVLAREVQKHPVKNVITHMDFLRVTPKTKLAVNITVNFLNEDQSEGIRAGGILSVVRREVEVVCSVDALPDSLDCDLTKFVIGDTIHISDVELPEGVTPVISDRDFVVANISAPKLRDEEETSDADVAETEDADETEAADEDAPE